MSEEEIIGMVVFVVGALIMSIGALITTVTMSNDFSSLFNIGVIVVAIGIIINIASSFYYDYKNRRQTK